jgi:SlyX protein
MSENAIMSAPTTESIERIELKIAYLERANNDLSEVVYRQQQQLDALQARLLELTGKMASALSEQSAYTAEQERPPHY